MDSSEAQIADVQTNNSQKTRTMTSRKYNLRIKSIQNRNESQHRKNDPRNTLSKTRPAPLSKYRRKTANLRERCRMQEINDAFKRLQSVVPDIFSIADKSSHSMAKLTKINTLKLAVNYISALTQILKQSDDNSSHTNCVQDENDKPTDGDKLKPSTVTNKNESLMNVHSITNCDQFNLCNNNNNNNNNNHNHHNNNNHHHHHHSDQILNSNEIFSNSNYGNNENNKNPNNNDNNNNQKYTLSFQNEHFKHTEENNLFSDSQLDKYKINDNSDDFDDMRTIFEDLDSLFEDFGS